MKAAIFGSAGLVGSACSDLFKQKDWEVIGVDNNGRSQFFGTERKDGFINLDIRNQVDMEDFFSAHKFDAVINAAAQPSHDYATDHVLEDFSVNALGALNLLECTRQTSPQAIFVHISTDKVYGENMSCNLIATETRWEASHPDYFKGFDETLGLDFAGDRSFFGCSKAAADMYAQQYGQRGLKTVIFRPGCITGRNHAGAEFHGFLSYLAKCIREGKHYKIFGNGKQVRDQIHASDFASAIYEVVTKTRAGWYSDVSQEDAYPGLVYNMGGGPERSVSVLEAMFLLQKHGEENGYDVEKFTYEFAPERLGDRRWDVHDVSKFRKDYPDWDYKYSLESIAKELMWDGVL